MCMCIVNSTELRREYTNKTGNSVARVSNLCLKLSFLLYTHILETNDNYV